MITDRIRRLAAALGLAVLLTALPGGVGAAPRGTASTGDAGIAAEPPGSPTCGGPAVSSAPAMIACTSGGDGATECETGRTVNFSGLGYTSGCGISCGTGYYACCQEASIARNAQCSCQPYPQQGPWTPELPW